jgi:hypothetical protein
VKREARTWPCPRQIRAPAQLHVIEADDRVAARQQHIDEMAADKTRGAGDEAFDAHCVRRLKTVPRAIVETVGRARHLSASRERVPTLDPLAERTPPRRRRETPFYFRLASPEVNP